MNNIFQAFLKDFTFSFRLLDHNRLDIVWFKIAMIIFKRSFFRFKIQIELIFLFRLFELSLLLALFCFAVIVLNSDRFVAFVVQTLVCTDVHIHRIAFRFLFALQLLHRFEVVDLFTISVAVGMRQFGSFRIL
jgi:hypothetical protein